MSDGVSHAGEVPRRPNAAEHGGASYRDPSAALTVVVPQRIIGEPHSHADPPTGLAIGDLRALFDTRREPSVLVRQQRTRRCSRRSSLERFVPMLGNGPGSAFNDGPSMISPSITIGALLPRQRNVSLNLAGLVSGYRSTLPYRNNRVVPGGSAPLKGSPSPVKGVQSWGSAPAG
jgi:hypothetical protein